MNAVPTNTHRSRLALVSLTTILAFGGLRDAALATTYVVTKTADTLDGACNADCSLREAVRAANAHAGSDVIDIPAGTYLLTRAGSGEDAALKGDLDITGAVTLQGASAATTIVDGGGLDRVFDVDADGITLIRSLTIRGGNAGTDSGGGVAASTEIAMTDCVVTGNAAGLGGGGISAYMLTFEDGAVTENLVLSSGTLGTGGGIGGHFLTIRRSDVSRNRIESPDGWGAGIGVADGQLELVASTVSQNVNVDTGSTPSWGGGGGIAVVGWSGGGRIERTGIHGNRADDGGGIATYTFYGETLVVERSTLSGNLANVRGGGAWLYRFGDAADEGVTFENCTFSGNRGPAGAALSGDALSVSSCTITGNLDAQGKDVPFDASIDGTPFANSLVTGVDTSSATVTSLGGNLESPGNTFGFTHASDHVNVADPKILPLAWNGGPTRTHALDPASPAVDAGLAANGLPLDQRGQARPTGAGHDVGAYERDGTSTRFGSIHFDLIPWPYIYVYTGCPGPIILSGGEGEVVVDVVITAGGAPLQLEVASTPRWGRAQVIGNVLRFTTRTVGSDDVAVAVSDGVHRDVVVLPFDVTTGCAPIADRPAGCAVTMFN